MGELTAEQERQPWLMNTDEGYEMPEDVDRCDARYMGRFRCAHWKETPHKLHWAVGGNLEWADADAKRLTESK